MFLPLTLYMDMKYARIVPMTIASTVTQVVTEKLFIMD